MNVKRSYSEARILSKVDEKYRGYSGFFSRTYMKLGGTLLKAANAIKTWAKCSMVTL